MTISCRLLSVPERRCIGALYLPEPLENLPGVGKRSIDRLLQLGLIEETKGPRGSHGPYYRRTDAGNDVFGRCGVGGLSLASSY